MRAIAKRRGRCPSRCASGRGDRAPGSTTPTAAPGRHEHSRKPDEQHGLIESCSPGPYLELFARYPREGWSAWGSEAAAEIEPKGKRYKGYEGGGIVLPAGLERGEASRDSEKV